MQHTDHIEAGVQTLAMLLMAEPPGSLLVYLASATATQLRYRGGTLGWEAIVTHKGVSVSDTAGSMQASIARAVARWYVQTGETMGGLRTRTDGGWPRLVGGKAAPSA